ncbi:MAG: hypothetical protein R3F54_10495 [Alphaproteobacteria bacterium]
MEPLLAAIQASDLATALRFSRWSYAAVNTCHVLGIALLIGAIIPLDLRLLGAWPSVEQRTLVRVLTPLAAFGLMLAVTAGLLLFSARAVEYAALGVFRLKLALILLGATSAIVMHATYGALLEHARPSVLRLAALLSMSCWIGALIAGRLIAFLAD